MKTMWTPKSAQPALMGHTRPRDRWTPWCLWRDPRLEARVGKRPTTGGGAIYLQTGLSHAHMEAKEEVDGVLGALGEAQDPVYCRSPGLCHAHGPLIGGRKEDRGKTVGGMWMPPWTS